MKRLELYTRAECHLCHEAQAVIEHVRREIDCELEVTDIDSDPDLVERYGLHIPVLLIDGEFFARYRVDEAQLREYMSRA